MSWNVPLFDSTGLLKDARVGGQSAEALLSLANETVAEEDGTMTFQVVRGSDGQDIIAYDFRTVEGAAVPNSDYTHLSGSTWVSSGETNDHDVTILDDAVPESTEALTFEVFNIRFLT